MCWRRTLGLTSISPGIAELCSEWYGCDTTHASDTPTTNTHAANVHVRARRQRAAILAVQLLAVPCIEGQQVDQAANLRVAVATTPLRIDGALNESAWQLADSITTLTQVEPHQGAAPSARTVVRVLATADAIVIGVRADYADGVGIVSYALSRDAVLDNEDNIKIVLDTYRDRRSGYVFAVNANGARYDALIAGPGESENANWDAIWEAATVRTARGWSAEIRIPVKSLLFRPDLTEWGFNIQRRIQQLQETVRWTGAAQDYKVTQTSRAGVLTGLPSFALGLGLSIRPSLTVGGARDSAGLPLRNGSHGSLDVTQRVGSNALASLTVNTDFAETEVDTRRVNLTRFPLFFPEKRTFFLEGADIFDFGLGLSGEVVPFFSRRVGIDDGVQVPIRAGLKLNGRSSGTSYGVLAVRTGDTDTLNTGTQLAALRVKRDVLGESSVGFIATLGDPTSRAGSWLAGPDLTYRNSRFRGDKNLLIGAWALGVGRSDLRGDRSAVGLKIDYPNDRWDIAASYKRIGESFDPSLGFVPRSGVHLVAASANWQPRPKQPIAGMHIRQCFWENELSYAAGLTGAWQSYRYFMAPVNCRLESGDRFEFNIVPTGERLAAPFEIADGITLPAGAYHFQRYRIEGGLAQKRRLNAQATIWFGGFYNGHLTQYQLTGAWKPSALFTLEFNGEHDVGTLPQGHFVQDVLGTRLRINVSPDLQFASFLQYDTGSNAFGTNTRVRWTFSSLGDLFVVYNHALRTRDPVTLRPELKFGSNQFLAKVQYVFRY